MGRNAAIKRYDPRIGISPANLFVSKEGRLPIIAELLRTPWIFVGSDLKVSCSAGIGKLRERIISVAWDDHCRCPSAFIWNDRTYRIDAIVQVWAIERYWWDPRRRVSRRIWRVLAGEGTYDLAYDRLERAWRLVAVQD